MHLGVREFRFRSVTSVFGCRLNRRKRKCGEKKKKKKRKVLSRERELKDEDDEGGQGDEPNGRVP